VEILPGNIGYLKIDYFPDPRVCGEIAVAAMRFVAHGDAFIFDLLENGGGDPAMIALISTYLLQGRRTWVTSGPAQRMKLNNTGRCRMYQESVRRKLRFTFLRLRTHSQALKGSPTT
jgi:hypothetical protein